ncbi:MAG: ABC transporter ATP-binding protein [Acetobacteraceae bacterium]|nr:ABC transporter ATP-binding protein [Acetobacteraceae bacterium]MCX7685698.1 ABC transporter ATP-binding protein [Acetobacteraceae bacterium]MDW8399124.1 ABC transporter ATP-binding protein [Acetobacteraceae bacterium]
MTAAALAAHGLTRRFGSLVAVDGVSLALSVGELHAVIGPNGAGKSTLVNLLAGELAPSAGRLLVGGREVTGWPAWRIARAGIGRSFQKTNLMRDLSVFENVRLAAQAATGEGWLRRASAAGRAAAAARAAIARVGLEGFEEAKAGILPHGRQRLLEIAMALASGPKVLLLDEPLAGMGAEESERIAALIRALAADHAVLLIEHDMDVVFRIADRLTVMVEGRVLESGPPEAIRASAAVRDAYLGHDL